ncbi:hypothetical protein [Streptomyces sp. NPDC018031]|uniref:hypothetical protein n=1 Tax=Streptomyces sp. NPDC018031 TaxID=3365033 RepID=UPI0037B476F0
MAMGQAGASGEDRDARSEPAEDRRSTRPERSARVRIPGFIGGDDGDSDIGLGDAVKRVTYAAGLRRPCGGCERRAAALNRWVAFSRRGGRG